VDQEDRSGIMGKSPRDKQVLTKYGWLCEGETRSHMGSCEDKANRSYI
jgi:hypothetical protein